MPGWRADSRPAWKRAKELLLAFCLVAAAGASPAQAATVVSLTFDDGQATQYTTRSTLASHGMNATFYLNSSKVGTSAFYMTWSEVAALHADGNEIGGHTLTHVDLTSPTLTDAQKRAEICDDRQSLVAHGFDAVSFAYPYSATNASVQTMAAECGYTSARRVGGLVSPAWCPTCGSPRAEAMPPANAFNVRTPSFGSGEITLAAMQDVITQAEISGGGWVPLVFHGICDSACDSGWIKLSTFSALLDWLEQREGQGTVVRTMRAVMEHTPADTSIGSKPAALANTPAASFTLSSNPTGASFECSLDGAAFAPCTSSPSYSGLGDGAHTFSARARDVFGSIDATPATWTWIVDTTAPETSIVSGPAAIVAVASASFVFTATDAASFECRRDGGAWQACSSPAVYSGLASGVHTFAARAIDAAGNVETTPATRVWTIDAISPNTRIVTGPSETVASTVATFAFDATEPGSFECRLDGAAWTACTSPRSYSGLADGNHTFSVRAADGVGNVDPSAASRSWRVDTSEDSSPEDPPDPPVDDPDDEWAPAYISQLLRRGVRSNKRMRLRELVRGRPLKFAVPPAENGRLRITLSLIPDGPGRNVKLGRARAESSDEAQVLALRLGRKARRRLRPLWVAALEFTATFEPAGGAVAYDRRVLTLRR